MVDKKYSEMPDSIIEQSAIASVQKEYQVLGVNLDKKQNDYILMAGLKMLGVAAISMLAAVLITLLSAKVAAELGKVVREKVYKKVLSFSNNEYRKFGSSSLIIPILDSISNTSSALSDNFLESGNIAALNGAIFGLKCKTVLTSPSAISSSS